MKRKIAIILCAALLAATMSGILAGCGNGKEEPTDLTESPANTSEVTDDGSDDDAPTGENDDTDASSLYNYSIDIDYEKAFAAYASDTVMLKSGDLTVTWEELFLYLHGNISDFINNTGMVPPWAGVLYEDETYADAILEIAIDNATFYKAIEHGAAQAGITLSDDDLELMQQDYDEASEFYGSEDEFLALLWESNGCHSRELYFYLAGVGKLANNYFAEYFGEEGELMSDEDLEDYIRAEGYMMAKHILRMKTDDGENTALSEAEDILNSLENYDGDDFNEYFTEMMFTHSEDNLYTFPNGYLFVFNDMVMSFSAACSALEPGELSGIVESEYGYHIIYRIPIDYNEIPLSNFAQGNYSSLRRTAALSIFDSVMYGWLGGIELERTPELESIDLAAIFKQE